MIQSSKRIPFRHFTVQRIETFSRSQRSFELVELVRFNKFYMLNYFLHRFHSYILSAILPLLETLLFTCRTTIKFYIPRLRPLIPLVNQVRHLHPSRRTTSSTRCSHYIVAVHPLQVSNSREKERGRGSILALGYCQSETITYARFSQEQRVPGDDIERAISEQRDSDIGLAKERDSTLTLIARTLYRAYICMGATLRPGSVYPRRYIAGRMAAR